MPHKDFWLAKIDQMKEFHHMTSDTEAAKTLGISQQAMSQVRNGTSNLGILPRLIVLNKTGTTTLNEAIRILKEYP